MGDSGRCDTENSAQVEKLIGQRVVVRHRVGEKLSDAVGELAVEGADLVVRTRRGAVRVARSAVTAVRAVPPPVPRRASLSAIARLEELCADAWPALVEERLGAWRLRAAGGYTGRANAALAIGTPGMPTDAALDVVRDFAGRQGIAPRVQVPIGSPWDRAVAAEGWVLDDGHAAGAVVSVQVAELSLLAAVGRGESREAEAPRVEWVACARQRNDTAPPDHTGPPDHTARPDDGAPADYNATPDYAAARGEPTRPSDAWWRLVLGAPPTPAQGHVLASPQGAGFLLLLDDAGVAVGAGRAVVVDDHVHLSLLTVDPAVRRRGHGSRLLTAAAAWGRDRGARWGVLQVAVHNAPALALYAETGWVEHHRYRYLVPPPRQ